ncbi:hypothetical protein AAVH_41273, partial [Aphelenchoides avenae]
FYVRKCIGAWLTQKNRHSLIAACNNAVISVTETKLGDFHVRINGQPACIEAARETIDSVEVYTFPISCLKAAWLSSRRSSPMRGSFNLKDIMDKTETYIELPSFSRGQLDSGTCTIVAASATSVRRALDLMELDSIVVDHINTSRIKSTEAAHVRKELWAKLSESTDTFIHRACPQGASYIVVVGRQRGIIDVKRRLAVAAGSLIVSSATEVPELRTSCSE